MSKPGNDEKHMTNFHFEKQNAKQLQIVAKRCEMFQIFRKFSKFSKQTRKSKTIASRIFYFKKERRKNTELHEVHVKAHVT